MVSIIFLISSFDIGFVVVVSDGEELRLFSCVCLVIGRLGFYPTTTLFRTRASVDAKVKY